MVDSKGKGSRAETLVRDTLRSKTGLKWERTPGSGALDPKHMLKGDLYIPGEKNLYCVEVKHYKEDHLTSSIFTAKSPTLFMWWDQAYSQAKLTNQKPLLIFKHDRSKLLCGFDTFPNMDNCMYLYINTENPFYVSLLDDYLNSEKPKFII